MVNQHATVGALFGVAVIVVWWLHRRRGGVAEQLELLTMLGVLIAAQGLVGAVQYELKLPAEMVWVHAALATATWVVLLWVAPAKAGWHLPGPEAPNRMRACACTQTASRASIPGDSLSGSVGER